MHYWDWVSRWVWRQEIKHGFCTCVELIKVWTCCILSCLGFIFLVVKIFHMLNDSFEKGFHWDVWSHWGIICMYQKMSDYLRIFVFKYLFKHDFIKIELCRFLITNTRKKWMKILIQLNPFQFTRNFFYFSDFNLFIIRYTSNSVLTKGI